jgi:hypothetical protein
MGAIGCPLSLAQRSSSRRRFLAQRSRAQHSLAQRSSRRDVDRNDHPLRCVGVKRRGQQRGLDMTAAQEPRRRVSGAMGARVAWGRSGVPLSRSDLVHSTLSRSDLPAATSNVPGSPHPMGPEPHPSPNFRVRHLIAAVTGTAPRGGFRPRQRPGRWCVFPSADAETGEGEVSGRGVSHQPCAPRRRAPWGRSGAPSLSRSDPQAAGALSRSDLVRSTLSRSDLPAATSNMPGSHHPSFPSARRRGRNQPHGSRPATEKGTGQALFPVAKVTC